VINNVFGELSVHNLSTLIEDPKNKLEEL